MWPNPQFSADFATFTEEIFNEKLHFLRSESCSQLVVAFKIYHKSTLKARWFTFRDSFVKWSSHSTINSLPEVTLQYW